jgi:UDP-N-acetylmuramoyl-tripeptide--D-alanyl-D-alanine ligase
MRLSEVIEATGAKPVNIRAPETVAVTGVCIDSRVVEAGDLFVALRGNRTDGHQYLQEVFDRGAIAALVEYVPLGAEEMPLLRTPNTVHALGQLARHYRRQFNATVIGITGSTGKTTTKEMIAARAGGGLPERSAKKRRKLKH